MLLPLPWLSCILLVWLFFRTQGNASSIQPVQSSSSLLRRDDYTCGPGRPCKNSACCGASGNCGYGPIYCGGGCTSNCDASAECGQFSKPTNKTCPLNTCCSQYGFCGTLEGQSHVDESPGMFLTSVEYCGKGCQSNCELHPKPPGGSPQNKVLSKIIGYYEAWNARSKCHQTLPTDLPLDALTHLNYAFAYISPDTLQITTMDAATPASLFDDLAALKVTKPHLQIFVSIGGWTFSDNDTATQPLFGNIARSDSNRQKFADNTLTFLNLYGFDGVDLDWEYPGAPDRGGKPDDTKNYVQLVKTLRDTFDKSGRKLGITFTAPSSYWYMRWFDLPGMLQYADWMNFMTYDIHGVWDSTNPIGAIIQGHTNLTEIKLAAELLWRVEIQPSQVALGFGFYGRAFTLANPACTTPGCPFSGGAKPGDVLSKHKDIKVMHDTEAAVKYFSWDSTQWISYDDAETFKQKTDWANDLGLAGSLIWASDLDDYTWSAHKALTGKSNIGKPVAALYDNQQQSLVDTINTDLGHACYKFPDSVDFDKIQVSACSSGYVRVGYDKDGQDCKDGECGKPICCRKDSGLKNCQWRGGGKDCNGQCHAGEVKISGSSWGGTPGESGTGRCNRGGKAFCCEMGLYSTLADKCYWTGGNNNPCKKDEQSVAHMWDHSGWGTVFSHGSDYCCPKSQPMPFTGCHWVGQGDCADNTCDNTEVTLLTDDRGDSYSACSWWRKKSLCCKPSIDAFQTLTCDDGLCWDDPNRCEDDIGPSDPEGGWYIVSSYLMRDGTRMWSYSSEPPWVILAGPVRPGDPRQMMLKVGALVKSSFYGTLELRTRAYATGLKLLQKDGSATLAIKGGYSMLSDTCDTTAVQFIKAADLPRSGMQAEHYQEFQMIPAFLRTALTGYLPSGERLHSAVLDPKALLANWNKAYDTTLPRIGDLVTDVKGWAAPLTPNDRIFEILGSYAYRASMSLLPGDMNLIKMNVMRQFRPMSANNFATYLSDAIKGDEEAAKKILDVLRKTIGVFNYLNDDFLNSAMSKARTDLVTEIGYAEKYANLVYLHAIWKEFEPDYYSTAAEFAREWVSLNLKLIAQKLPMGVPGNPAVAKLIYESGQLYKAVQRIKSPVAS
ncbi:hypothetical protein FE257_008430 [Aspergillus nanangensis]|uniref:chitinase n=1 Tax=Aspergillus nanangensis TaxID=2582783 RepID=A0AAD4GTG3_ASPNN|nr:hypothetical protein FE257_008430 [Aspergillus nanangensis]